MVRSRLGIFFPKHYVQYTEKWSSKQARIQIEPIFYSRILGMYSLSKLMVKRPPNQPIFLTKLRKCNLHCLGFLYHGVYICIVNTHFIDEKYFA